jgi:hypothetical protein
VSAPGTACVAGHRVLFDPPLGQEGPSVVTGSAALPPDGTRCSTPKILRRVVRGLLEDVGRFDDERVALPASTRIAHMAPEGRLERLASLTPRPRRNIVLYDGCSGRMPRGGRGCPLRVLRCTRRRSSESFAIWACPPRCRRHDPRVRRPGGRRPASLSGSTRRDRR